MVKNAGPFTVWVSAQDKIASFHFVEGYAQMDFQDHDTMLGYVQSLACQGYHFT